MCRLMTFSGTCTCCGEEFAWEDLAQELSCLEAKNTGVFGDCRRGIHKEEHRFDQECDECVARNGIDEGYGDWEQEQTFEHELSGKGGDGNSKGKHKDDFYQDHGNTPEETKYEEDGGRRKKQRTS
ncbi:hypothetical protein V8F33_000674 [Rhypophila sp. PSN 637]